MKEIGELQVLIYTRVSTIGQAEGYSLETQREACEKRAREIGATTITYLEDTFTGTSLERPAMEQLRSLVKGREADKIIVYDPDRFSRDLNDLLIVTKEIDRAGIELIFINFEWQNTPQGMLFLQLRGAIAQFEHAQIKERTQRGKTKKAAKGKLRTWAQPYGYCYDKENSTLVIDPTQAPVVAEMYQWAVQGLSCVDIAKRLAGKGIPGPTGKGWDYTTVLRILRRTTYSGVMTRKDERPDWTPIRVPPIVSQERWQQVQGQLARTKRFSPRKPKREYLLRGILSCAFCGGPLSVNLQTRKASGTAYSYYRCIRHRRRKYGEDAPKPCPLRDMNTEQLDQAVWGKIREVLLQPEIHLPYLEEEFRNSARLANDRLSDARDKRQQVLIQLRRANNLYMNGGYDPADEERNDAQYQRVLANLKHELELLEAQIRTYEQVVRQRAEAEETARLAREWGAHLHETIDLLPFSVRQELIKTLVTDIQISNKTITVTGHFNSATCGGTEAGVASCEV